MSKEAGDTYRGDADRGPWQEVAAIVEGREERNAKPAVGHSVEETVADCGEEKICPQGKAAEAGRAMWKGNDHGTGEKRGEDKRVREATMSPKIAVANAETKSDDIDVGEHGAHDADHPDALRNVRPVEAGSDTKSGYRV